MKMLVTVLGVVLMLVPVLSTHNSRGSYAKPQERQVQALESVTASEVEYVDGPLAPLYDFLIQKRLQRFCKLLRDAKVEDVIQNLGGSWTLFAPTDSSFIFLPGGTLEELQANPEMMRDFILYHFVAGDLPASEIQNELLADSVQGSPLRFNIYEQVFTVSGAQILESDLQFELGRVHIVDHPLYPIPSTDIVNYLQNNYREIYKLLLDTGLADYVSSGTFTFLVPDDPSFNFLSVELKDALAANISLAEKILLNHILPGSIYVGGITDGMQWQTVGGNVITFTIKRGLTFANGIPIIFPDVPMTNGVIHILNRVLLPEDVEVDCQCKPSSDSSQKPSREVPGRLDQRPPFGQVTTTQKPAGQFFQKPTQRPASQQPAKTPQRSRPGSQVSSQMTPPAQNQPGRAPFIPSRTRQPSPGSSQTAGSPLEQPAGQVLPEDDTNTVLGPDRDDFGSQKRPDQMSTTKYPPFQRRGPNTHHQQNRYPTTSTTISDFQPDVAPDNNINGQDNDRTSQVPRQPSRWTNRQPTVSSRYPPPPPPPRNPYRTTVKPFQTTRPNGWGQARATQPSIGAQPGSDNNPELSPVTENENQFQTNKPTVKTTSWQVRKQPTRAPWQSNQQRTTYRPSRVTPTQRRPIQPRPTVTPTPSSTNAPFESNRQRPVCRQRSDRVTSLNQNLPVCTEPSFDDCQNLPYNPSDPRPLCPETGDSPNCRDANEPFNQLDTRPLCPTSAQPGTQNCRNSEQPAYIGDRRPLCSLPTTAQSACRDSSTPFNPTDTRPLCRISGSQNIPPVSPQSPCKKPNEVSSPDDNRPFCQDEQQQDCRPFLERPKPGDRRPVCKVNRQPPSQSQKPVKVTQPPRQSYPQGGRQPSFQTTRRQVWQPTTQPPQNQLNPVDNVRQPQVGKRPQTNTASKPLNPVTPDSFQSRPQAGSHQSRPTSGFQPQIGTHQTTPPTGVNHPQSFQPQTGTQTFQPNAGPLRPQSDLHPAPPSESVGFQPQPPSSVNQPQTNPNLGSYPSSQQTGPQRSTSSQTPSQRPYSNSRPGSPNRPTSGNYPSTNQRTPSNTQGQQIGSFTPGPSRGTSVSRKPISVTGTSTTPGEDTRRTLYEIVEDPALLIRGHPVKLTKILLLFQKAGIEDLLTGPGPTTVFLPSDDAFSTLPKGVVDQLEENPELLRQVLLYHVVSSEVLPSSAGESFTLPSLEGTQLVITMLNGGRLILISGAKAIAVTRASNGIFYVINQLLYPLPHDNIVGAIQSRPDLSTLAFLLPLSGLQDLLQGQTPYTLLAPTDNAFAQLPAVVYDEISRNTTALQEILLNHVIEGAHYGREFLTGATYPSARGGKLKFQVVSYGYQVNDINIKTPEIVTGTGVIHLIDQILLEPNDLQYFNALENSQSGGDNAADTNDQTPPAENPWMSPRQRTPQNRPSTAQKLSQSGQAQSSGMQAVSNPALEPGRRPIQGTGQQAPSWQQPSSGHSSNSANGNRAPVRGNVNQHRPSAGQQQSTGRRRQPVFQPQSQTQSQGQPNIPIQPQTQGTGAPQGQPNDVAELARSMGLNHFANWITNTGLLEKVHDGGVYTVFAPTDDAINSLPQEMVYSIDTNPDQMKSLMQYHIIPQRINLNSLGNDESASTLLQGKSIRFNVYGNGQSNCRQMVTASGTPIGEALATMGSVQVIPVTQVLYQPAGNLLKIIEASPILTNLSQAVREARVTWILSGTGPMTLFAPSDLAFQSLSDEERQRFVQDKQAFSDLLKRHILRGTFFSSGIQDDLEKKSENGQPITISLHEGIMTINSAPVTYSDITATNGVLHVIDQFL